MVLLVMSAGPRAQSAELLIRERIASVFFMLLIHCVSGLCGIVYSPPLMIGNRARTRHVGRAADLRAAYRAGAVSFVRLPVTVVVAGVVVRFGSVVMMVRPFVRFMLGAMPRTVGEGAVAFIIFAGTAQQDNCCQKGGI